ncbi:class I SAM-dependent methyltransferase [Cystobacter fuscus]|uniref:class I SAM-dependent methyltransferase n=1 Tax=Cystobacter fuscus TaxID=43 RepID=UPI002B313BD7|nr:class I SAM-dependent methyltransferase [Cystobacter fuscus]
MGLYERHVLPPLLDLVMRNSEMTRQRQLLVPRARGRVLEVGIGSGLNLPFYGPGVERLWGVDPSLELQRQARARAEGRPFPVELLAHPAEALPLETHGVDTVVMTWTLCSIPDALRALEEIRRVLVPGGRLLFVEHGLAPQARVERLQRWLTPGWKRFAGGCRLDRKVDALLEEAGFQLEHLECFYLRGPRPMTFTYRGEARPR